MEQSIVDVKERDTEVTTFTELNTQFCRLFIKWWCYR